GPNPQVAKGTHVLIPLGETSATGWTAEVEGEGAEPPAGPALNLRLAAPPDAPIGRYRLSVKTRTGAGEYAAPFDDANDFFLLFNPWCPGEPGPFWGQKAQIRAISGLPGGRFGGFGAPRGKNWRFRGSPGEKLGGLLVSPQVNSLDDNGVLVGNWTGEYGQGTNPSAWAGSVAIL
ncbi:TGM1 glutamyltransferase, partial [Rhinoptilus africanus]|nr:TGM1 glutamyltransferase [Rhinoptilus africanus]